MKIRHRLTLAFVGIAAMVPVVGYVSTRAGTQAIESSMGDSSTNLTRRLLAEVNQNIWTEVKWFKELAGAPVVQRITRESNERFAQMPDPAAYIDEQDRQWVATSRDEITTFMRAIIENDVSERLRRKTQFTESESGHETYGEIFITNRYGANVAQTGKTSDYNQADEAWWQNAKRDGLYLSDVTFDDSSNIRAIDICVRIDDPNGAFAGVIKAVLNIEEVTQLLRNAEAVEGANVGFSLIADDGTMMYPLEETVAGMAGVDCRSTDECTEWNAHYSIQRGCGPDGQDILVAHAHSPRSAQYESMGWTLIMKHSTAAQLAPMNRMRAELLVLSLVMTALSLFLGLGISGGISRRLSNLSNAAARIGTGGLDVNVSAIRNDEIGQLANSLKTMADNLKATTTSLDTLNREVVDRQRAEEELAQANRRLVQTAHNAGKAQVASAVLHNVGNAVNSINVIASTVKNRLSSLKLNYLTKAAALLEQHKDNLAAFLTHDQKGQKLLPYLVELAGELAEQHQYILRKMEALTSQIHHTSEIINIQQSHSKGRGLIEQVSLADTIEDAVQINAAAIEQHGIELVRRFMPVAAVEADRSQVVQILVNLIGNAVYAVLAADSPHKVITLSTRALTDEYIQIEVADNGIGIPKENAAHIFEYGFTTKKKGHGFGLHGGAIAAKEMGGKLVAYSRGTGMGAAFVLELPVKSSRQAEVNV